MASDPPRDGDLPAGYDEGDPYSDCNLDDLPDWWQSNVVLFEEYGLRPYRPSRFDDDELVPSLTKKLEQEFDIEITIKSRNPHTGDARVFLDQEPILSIDRIRESGGFTRYGITSKRFRLCIEKNREVNQ